MPCARAEDALPSAAIAALEMPSSAAAAAAAGGLIQKVGGGRRSGGSGRALHRSAHLSAEDDGHAPPPASCSKDDKIGGGGKREGSQRSRMRKYRSQLEQEVKKLQRQLEEEIDLHVALADAVMQNAGPVLNSSVKIPYKAQELLTNIASLESAVSKLEKDLNELYYQLCHERNERLLAESKPGCLPSTSPDHSLSTCTCTWEEHISSLRDLKFGGSESMRSTQQDLYSELEYEQDVGEDPEERQMVSLNRLFEKHRDVSLNRLLEKHRDEEMQESCSTDKEGEEDEKIDTLSFEQSILKITSMKVGNLWNNPNQLSEEMVRCMRNIFLRLSESSKMSPKESSDCSSSSAERLSGSTLASFSDSSIIPSMLRSPSVDSNRNDEMTTEASNFDPYKVNGKESRRDIGNYHSAAEVSWMSVGKEQLEYASEALKKFRFLVEQLSKVNPNSMNCDERLAFWINLYNALIMHAYLAYGVPRNDIKLFSLMQKSLMLALNKFKITEEHKKYSIDGTEPLVLFGLSCGMFSSPAVRIFSAANVRQELQESLRDYVQASVGISDRGKLLIPKLLQSYAKGNVEDSLLADWICHHLTPDQVAVIRDSSSQRKQRLLGARSFTVVAFDSKFRYLFLPDSSGSQKPEPKRTS
uniref:Ternary complex factor MIP1 leucine-zipper domain-containing protein n=1 Tax=Oryza rufipogon TaxID=4529 RepID=A0A0E0N9Z7_ORYRU